MYGTNNRVWQARKVVFFKYTCRRRFVFVLINAYEYCVNNNNDHTTRAYGRVVQRAGLWISFWRSSVQIPATAVIMIVISCAPLDRVLKSRQPQSVPMMPTSLWWNHLSDHPLVQWGITRGVSQETSLPRQGLLKKEKKFSRPPQIGLRSSRALPRNNDTRMI